MTLVLFVCGVFGLWVFPGTSLDQVAQSGSPQNLRVHFLDVGQGDSIFIQTPDGVEVLIDGGSNGTVLRALAQQMSFFDRKIDMIVGTHPDSDHIGGLVDVLGRYEVDTILVTENISDTSTARRYFLAVDTEQAEVVYARTGQEFALGEFVKLVVLYPESAVADMESNASSIVLQLVYGETEVMLTGDAPKRIEEYLVLTNGEHLQSDVLKLGHHGSRTSTSELFLQEVNPTHAVVSAEKDGRYGHPHVEVTDLLFNYGVETYSTAEEGTVTFESDGVDVWVR